MFFAKIPRHTRQNAITEGDLECILTRNCEGTEQLHENYHLGQKVKSHENGIGKNYQMETGKIIKYWKTGE